ncbi:hypothetical protein FACS1894104_0940 [Actinomycetota bacterium]|nr:hypothetical protein FACS1894104_0940 [Actinomycetota bacterium]
MTNLALKVLPKSSVNAIVGWTDATQSELAVKVQAPPTDGSANQALIKFLAQELGIAKSRIEIKCGQASRHKLLRIDIPDWQLADWLKAKQL